VRKDSHLLPIEVSVSVVTRHAFGKDKFLRLDAEFVRADVVREERAVSTLGGAELRSLRGAVGADAQAQPSIDARGEIDYIDIDSIDLDDGMALPERIAYSRRPDRAKYTLRANDILVSNVRPNRGAVSLITDRSQGAMASSGFTLIRAEADLAPVLFAYLRSEHVRRQLTRRERGSMYPAVLEQDVLDIVVPTFPDEVAREAEASVSAALEAQSAFFEGLRAASAMLDEFLAPYGTPPSPLDSAKSGVDTTIIDWSDAFGAGAARMDAEFFRSEYREFAERVMNGGPSFPLGRHFGLKSGRLSDGDDAVPTIKQAQLTNAGINWSSVEYRPGRCERTQVRAGDVLLASTAHEIAYVGRRVDFVSEVPGPLQACNQVVAEIIVLTPRDGERPSLSPFIAAFLRSAVGRNQVQRCIRGLRGGHTYPRDLEREVIVPDPGDEWLKEFASVAMGADRDRRAAKDATAQAVAVMDTFVAGMT
jgi:hypothetical protein